MKWAPRIRLRTIFLLIFCAAVGLASSTSPPPKVNPSLVGIIELLQLNWHYGLLSAASIPMAIGLVQQIRQLARLRHRNGTEKDEFTFAVRYGIVWRAIVAGTIAICLLVRLFVSRQFFELPEHYDLFSYDVIPDQLWLFCVIIVLSDSIARWQRNPARIRPFPWQPAAEWLFGTLLALLLLLGAAVIHFLVYLAVANIEGAQPLRFQRIGTYPDQLSEGFRLFWLSLAAVGVVVLAAATFTAIRLDDTWKRRSLKAGSFLVLLIAAATFCVWYYFDELPRISPDLAEAGFPGSWLDWLGASMLAVFVISGGAYRRARGQRSFKVTEHAANKRDQISLHESFACQLVLTTAAIIYMTEMFRGLFSRVALSKIGFAQLIHYMLQDPTTVLCLAICVLSLQLAWICWRRRKDIFVWELPELNRRRFVWNWLGVAALVVVGIPVISAYCFAFWLGPWYLYGD